MHLATEYILRNDRAIKLLPIPFSLFLTHKENGQKLIVSAHHHYGSNQIIIKHWHLWEDCGENQLPPFKEFKVNELLAPETIVAGYETLPFLENPFETGSKQHADPPRATMEANEYSSCLDTFFNHSYHLSERANWLWTQFDKVHVPPELRFSYCYEMNGSKDIQRDLVKFYSGSLWNKWKWWRKHLLDMPGFIAAELVFRKHYGYVEKPPKKSIYSTLWADYF